MLDGQNTSKNEFIFYKNATKYVILTLELKPVI